MAEFLTLGMELAAEISFPIGESTPSGILLIGGQIVGIMYNNIILCET